MLGLFAVVNLVNIFTGSWQNYSDDCILCSADDKWCERTTCNYSSIFNDWYGCTNDHCTFSSFL